MIIKFLIWMFFLIIVGRVFLSLFGGTILRFIAGRILKKANKAYERQYNSSADEVIDLDEDVKIKVGKKQARPKTKNNLAEVAEEVDYEEISDR